MLKAIINQNFRIYTNLVLSIFCMRYRLLPKSNTIGINRDRIAIVN